MGQKIFVNYRRDDDPAFAARVRDGLAAQFGPSNVFMDVDNLVAGQRFDVELARALDDCDVLVAIIGKRWLELLTAKCSSGERDYVCEEIASALKRGTVVIPVRVGRDGQMLPMPQADQLPEDIRQLIHHQKQDISHEVFGRDISALRDAINKLRQLRGVSRPPGRARHRLGIAAPLLWLFAVGIAAAIEMNQDPLSYQWLTDSVIRKTGEPLSVLNSNAFRHLVPAHRVINWRQITLVAVLPAMTFGFIWFVIAKKSAENCVRNVIFSLTKRKARRRADN